MSSAKRELASTMSALAIDFLESLSEQQRSIAQWSFDDVTERESWFYTPTDHGGLSLSQMGAGQQKHAHRLLASGLSQPGYNTAAVVIGLDNILDRLEGFIRDWGRERGRDPGLYYWRIFGDPSSGEPWSWRVGGHHISVHHVIVDGDVVGSTPLFLGADPASSPMMGTVLRPFGPVEDLARDLVNSLNDRQRSAALVSPVAPVDVVGCNRPSYGEGDGDLPLPLPEVWRGYLPGEWHELAGKVQQQAEELAGLTDEHREAVRLTRAPRGVAAAHMTQPQREVLCALLDLYAERLPQPLAELESAKYQGDRLDSVHFLWAGGTQPGEGYYYRAQSTSFMVEVDNTQRGANHIHTVWRDPIRDFGRDPLSKHYAEHAHGSVS